MLMIYSSVIFSCSSAFCSLTRWALRVVSVSLGSSKSYGCLSKVASKDFLLGFADFIKVFALPASLAVYETVQFQQMAWVEARRCFLRFNGGRAIGSVSGKVGLKAFLEMVCGLDVEEVSRRLSL